MASILIIDDSPTYKKFVELLASNNHTILKTKTADEGLALIKKHMPDLILANLFTTNLNGFEFAQKLHDHLTKKEIPIIFYTSFYPLDNAENREQLEKHNRENPAKEKIKAEASSLQQEKIDYMIKHDALTGLLNRYEMEKKLNKLIKKTTSSAIALIVLDLDRFRLINDAIGHDAGDILLENFAERVRHMTRYSEDFTARIGSNRFAVILQQVNNIHHLIQHAKKILLMIKKPFLIKNQEIFMTASIGISLYPQDGRDSNTLLKHADIVLNQVKEQGGNYFQFYTADLPFLASEKLATEMQLRHALAERQLCLFYQPIINLKTGKITSVEALLRWQHPKKGLLSPDYFLDIADKTGLIIPIGEWVLREVCQFIIDKKITVPVAVNISVHQFKKQYDLIRYLKPILNEFQLSPHHLELEITENAMATELERVIATSYELKKMGIKVSLDDFGSGYSSFNYFKRFFIDKIKIDQSFINAIETDHKAKIIVKTMIGLAHSLGVDVIAEGVVTEEQLKFLISEGCDAMQGFYFSPPLLPHEVSALIEKKTTLTLPR